MKSLSLLAFVAVCFSGCLTTPVDKTGSATARNTNPAAILSAAQSVFAESGYSVGPVDFPNSASFDKPSGAFGKALYGSYDQTTSVRARVTFTPIPGTSDYRLSAKAYAVNNAGDAGFESARPLLVGSGQFAPLLRKIAAQASDAGGM